VFAYFHSAAMFNNNNNSLIYIAPACRMTSEALFRLDWKQRLFCFGVVTYVVSCVVAESFAEL